MTLITLILGFTCHCKDIYKILKLQYFCAFFCKKQVLVSKSLTIFVAIVEILSRHLDFYSVFAIVLSSENCQFSKHYKDNRHETPTHSVGGVCM